MTGKHILIVDDSQTVRVMVERILTGAGYEVVTARDGFEALSKVSIDTALVVLDVNMPQLDGYGFCDKLNELDAKYQNLPIVFLTSVESKALELLGRQYGAYLQKPVSPQKLLPAVEGLLSQAATSI